MTVRTGSRRGLSTPRESQLAMIKGFTLARGLQSNGLHPIRMGPAFPVATVQRVRRVRPENPDYDHRCEVIEPEQKVRPGRSGRRARDRYRGASAAGGGPGRSPAHPVPGVRPQRRAARGRIRARVAPARPSDPIHYAQADACADGRRFQQAAEESAQTGSRSNASKLQPRTPHRLWCQESVHSWVGNWCQLTG